MKPVLVIMAAGMGSRYGGLKQIDPVDEYGNKIIDFSIFDAKRAGFEEIIFLIKHEIEADFKAAIGERMKAHMKVDYAYQELSMIPRGVVLPKGRKKPLGTTHAVICASEAVGGRPFAVVNSDDYYGPEAFKILYAYLSSPHDPNEHLAVGYKVENTLTDNGSVTRGVCVVDGNNMLADIAERMKIFRRPGGAAYMDGEREIAIPGGTTVSMNCWGFEPGAMPLFRERFERELASGLERNPEKYEDLLPMAVCELINAGKARVHVTPTTEAWFGVTYKEDKPMVVENIRRLKASGLYPERLWD